LVVVVVVATDDFVVVVVVATDDLVVVVVTGTVVVVVAVGATVVVVTGAEVPSTAWTSASSVAGGTFGSVAVDGPNPTVINCLFRNLRSAAFDETAPPTCLSSLPLFWLAVDRVHERARTTPV